MLIGLAAKNAILIVEFAKRRREDSLDIVEAAIEAARLRLRPILMTAFAFILGAASRQSIGTTRSVACSPPPYTPLPSSRSSMRSSSTPAANPIGMIGTFA